MKLKSLAIRGFRGFNEERAIAFDDRLTLVYAPNSYGKTSISEALEWLLYGVTSKVRRAESGKEEYEDSYRNRHLSIEVSPCVSAIFHGSGADHEIKAELLEGNGIARYINGSPTDTWPSNWDLAIVPEPFILQHALKYLLLVRPEERFRGFAHILGLDNLSELKANFVSLCTKPEAAIPSAASQLRKDIDGVMARASALPSMFSIVKAYKKGLKGHEELDKLITNECNKRVPTGTQANEVLGCLLQARQEAVAKFFKGNVALPDYSEDELKNVADDERFLTSFLTDAFVESYLGLVALASVQHILDRANFFELGIQLLQHDPKRCPFCEGTIGDKESARILSEKEALLRGKERHTELARQRESVLAALSEVKSKAKAFVERHDAKTQGIRSLEASSERLKAVLCPKHEAQFCSVVDAISSLSSSASGVLSAYASVEAAVAQLSESISAGTEDGRLVTGLGDALVDLIAAGRTVQADVSSRAETVNLAGEVLKHELDLLAGTEELSVLIELHTRKKDIEKKLKIDSILDGLKTLKKTVEQYVGEKIAALIANELTDDVMEWYKQIRTTGDPDIHFDGFDLDRNAKGEIRPGRVQIKATSYGTELASAVSCLSESKLNALGLCISIAKNLKVDSPFEFLVIDDPIQSWDADHEAAFIEVIRSLIERGKQVILLSHNKRWLELVRKGCRDYNGVYYEISGYTKAGPSIHQLPWEAWKNRLRIVQAIIDDPDAGEVRCQLAEEEIRIVITEVAASLFEDKFKVKKSSHNLGGADVEAMLYQCGLDPGLIARVKETFVTTDDAHHSGEGYTPNKERIRRWHSYAHQLAQKLGK